MARLASMAAGLILCLSVTPSARAVPPSEHLLPETTTGYLSIPDLDELRDRWNETQLGQLFHDPVMEPFVEDFKRQLRTKLSQTGVRLGLTLEDLRDVAGGEVSLAVVRPVEAPRHALVLLADVTDHRQQAQALLEQIDARLREANASRSAVTLEGLAFRKYVVPDQRRPDLHHEAFIALRGDLLVATDHPEVAAQIASRIANGGASLSDVEAYALAMQRTSRAAGERHSQIRWFVEPFGYADALREASGGRRERGPDILNVLRGQGFTAVKGLGGQIHFATGDHEILHFTLVHAPAVNGAEIGQRYLLAARMLEFPNANRLEPQTFVPRDLATYFTFQWRMREAFDYSKTLVNQMMGAKEDEDLFEDMLGSLETDQDGPRISIRNDLVAHLGERATLITDAEVPVHPDSERLMVAVELLDPAAVEATLQRWMDFEPLARQHEIAGHVVWEILEEAAPVEFEAVQVSGQGFDPFRQQAERPADDTREERALPNMAITVADGHLFVASHVEFLRELLLRDPAAETLATSDDLQYVTASLDELIGGEHSFRLFTRTDEAYRTTYELLRQGRMPESKSLLGKLLNRLLGPEEEGVMREQELDGSKLPEFQVVRRYLGPAGLIVRSEEDGWFAAGCLLQKNLPVAVDRTVDDAALEGAALEESALEETILEESGPEDAVPGESTAEETGVGTGAEAAIPLTEGR